MNKDNEEKYVDYDEDTQMWCVFGLNTGFAYASFFSEQVAKDYLDDQLKQ